MTWLFLCIPLSALLFLGVPLLRLSSQKQLDHNRKTYVLTFPAELKEAELLSWLRHISGSIHKEAFLALPTMVFETYADDREIIHRLSMPWQDADYVIGQLQGLIPGISALPEEPRKRSTWGLAKEFMVRNTHHPLMLKDNLSMSTSMLLTFSHLQKAESAVLQWIITPIKRQPEPRPSVIDSMLGIPDPSKDDLARHKVKHDEPNFFGSFRIAVNANTDARRRHLLNALYLPLASTGRFSKAFTLDQGSLSQAVTQASSPWKYGCQLSASEIIPFLTWPLGSPLIAGLPSGATRHLPPTEAIPRDGRVIGTSTYPGTERPIAMSAKAGTTHVFVGGATEVGKTTLMSNMAKQDMEAGHGVIVLEAKGDLFYEVLDDVPYNRLDDVVVIDFTDGLRPVGFNLLDQGNPRTVVDELVELFQYKYKDDKGIWFRELMFHGLMTLATVKGLTFNDLSPLISPRDADEKTWANQIIKGVKDRELVKFWQRWNQLKESERVQHAGVVENRIWQLIGRIEPRYLFGQGTSSFQMEDIIRGNKILLVNLSGVPKESAEIVGTLLFNAIWEATQRVPTQKANYLYMDEFQMFADIPMGFDDVLALARKFKLGIVAATQYVERLPPNLSQAIKANARTKIIFQSNADGARIWQHEFGSKAVGISDITNLKLYQAIARINTDSGISSPVTIKTLPPFKKAGTAKAATLRSNQKYGRSVADIDREELERRKAEPVTRTNRPKIGLRSSD